MEHADDLPFLRRTELGDAWNQLLDVDALLERVATFHIAADEGFVDHSDARRAGNIALIESRGRAQSNAEGAEVSGSHHLEPGAGTRGRVREQAFRRS